MSLRHEPSGFDPLTLAAATWLAGGIVLLGLTPLPLRDPALGWSPAFWLLAAPALLLLAKLALAPGRSRAPGRCNIRAPRHAVVRPTRRDLANGKPRRRARTRAKRLTA